MGNTKNIYLKCSLLCIVLVVFSINSFGQKILLLEKAGTSKTQKIYIGETLTFKLLNDDAGWYERIIFDISLESKLINFEGVTIHIDSIEKIRFDKRPFVPSLLGTTLQAGGANVILYELTNSRVINPKRPVDPNTLYAGLVNIGVGTLLRKLFRHKKFTLSARKRLRLIDLTFPPPPKS